MGKMSRDKGYRAENELRHLFLDHDLDAKRIPLSGGAPGFPGDLIVPELFDGTAEVKCREDNPKRLWEWLEGNDALFLKRNRYEWLAVMPVEELIDLWKEAGKGMLARYHCSDCNKDQLCLIRNGSPPDEMKCPRCGAMAARTFPRINTHYKNSGFTKYIERKAEGE